MAKLLILGMNCKDGPAADRNYRGIMRKAYPNWKLPKYTTKESDILIEALSELTEARAPSYGDYETNYRDTLYAMCGVDGLCAATIRTAGRHRNHWYQ